MTGMVWLEWHDALFYGMDGSEATKMTNHERSQFLHRIQSQTSVPLFEGTILVWLLLAISASAGTLKRKK